LGTIWVSDYAMPGDFFYPVRTASEDIVLVLTLQPSKKADRHLLFAQDHLVACALAASQGRYEEAKIALRNYERHIAGAGRLEPSLKQETNGVDLLTFDFSRIFLEDLKTLQVLFPGEF
jgi:hypothetical protein